MIYSIKQVRYSGVNDGNTWRNQQTLTQADSPDEIRDIPVDLGTFLSTVLRIWAGPTHTPVQITLIILSQFHHHISYFKVDSHSFKSCVSSLLSNHCQSSVNDSQTVTTTHADTNQKFIRSTIFIKELCCKKMSATSLHIFLPSFLSIFPYFLYEDLGCAWTWCRPEV
jgi:hypothetical protein